MIRSLGMRMFWGATLASVAVLAILGAGLDQALRRALRAEFDSVLLQKARALASMVEQQGDDVHFDYQRTDFPEFGLGAHPAYFEIWLDGRRFEKSDSLTGALRLDEDGAPGYESRALRLPDQLPGRLVRWQFQPFLEGPESATAPAKPQPRPTGVVVVAQNTADLDRTLERIRTLIASLCGGAALVVGGVMLLVVRRTLRPLRHLATRIEALQPADLGCAISPAALPLELVPIVERLNGLLDRLAEAFNRERTFTADVAHELRTPLAGLLTTLEVSRSRARDPAAYQASIDRATAVLHQMAALVERLLLLARAEGGQLQARCDPMDLESLALECWLSFEQRARERGLTFSIDTQENHAAAGDAQWLAIIFKNLFDNAVSYAREASRVQMVIRSDPDRLTARIISDGHALTATDLPHVFDRFWRKDSARSQSGLHAGLGLSLCQRLMNLQKGRLTIELEGSAFIAEIELPLAQSHEAIHPSATALTGA